jgi:O-antigen ligase
MLTSAIRTEVLRVRTLRLRWKELLIVPAVLLLALGLGRSLAQGQIAFAGLVAGVVLIVALAQATWLPYIASAAFVGTFAEAYSLPQLGLPGNPFVFDLVLFAAFAAWLIVLSRADVPGPSAFPLAPQLAMAALLVGGLLGVVVATEKGVEPLTALGYSREIIFYATFWLALTAFADSRTRALVFRLIVGLALVIVLVQVAQGVLGPDTLLFYSNDPLRELITCPASQCVDPSAAGFPRVRPPGQVLVYVVACFATAYLLFGPRRRRALVGGLLGVCLVGILVSLNRNMLVGLLVGIVLAGLLATQRGRFAAVLTVASVVLIVSLAGAEASGAFRESNIVERVLSLTTVSELESSSTVSDREKENSLALGVLSRSPVEGIGWGVPYGRVITTWEDGELRTEEPLFIHNQYLGVWLRTGILGFAGFVAALVLSALYGGRWLRQRRESEDAWLGAGVITAVTALAISSLVHIYVLHPSFAPVLAGVIALAAVLRRDLGQASRPGQLRRAPARPNL